MPTLAEILRQTGYSQDETLAAPTPVEPTMTSILQKHIASLPQQLATNQAALDSAIGSWNKTDFGTGQPNPNYRPEAMQELTQLMPNIMGATAWHGTPHTIEGKFSAAKGGSGQGTQNFGHGTYFAENPTVAEGYMGRTVIQEPKLEHFTFNGPDYTISGNEYLKSGKPIPKAEYEKAFESITNLFNTQNKGNLYKVDIPDEMMPKMLNWYEDVPEDVRKRLSTKAMEQFGSGISPTTGEKLYKEIAFSLKQAGSTNPKADASAWLAEQGIPGIKYENFQIKKGQGANTSNYVVFEPENVKILEKNPSRKELIEKQVKDLKE